MKKLRSDQMKKTINPADAYRLAQARELIKCGDRAPHDADGKIIPSDESLNQINSEYEISEEIPPQHTKGFQS